MSIRSFAALHHLLLQHGGGDSCPPPPPPGRAADGPTLATVAPIMKRKATSIFTMEKPS